MQCGTIWKMGGNSLGVHVTSTLSLDEDSAVTIDVTLFCMGCSLLMGSIYARSSQQKCNTH